MKYQCIASAAFGLEGIVAKELERLGIGAKGENGGARFEAGLNEIFKANVYLRCADRIFIILAEQEVMSFDEIFDTVANIQWHTLLPQDAQILVTAKCVRSQIMSTRDCQSIAKKAIVKQMQAAYNTQVLPETGVSFHVDIAIHSNMMRVSLDTTGDALNKRGYRTWNAEAPIRETLAAAILNIAPWRMRMPLHDPCCGSATFLIEAAFMATRRASGLERSFAMEHWPVVDAVQLENIRNEAKELFDLDREIQISGSDIDNEVLQLAKKHLQQAKLQGKVKVWNSDLSNLQLDEKFGCFIVNPPYGERLSEQKQCRKLYVELGKLLQRHPTWSMAVITSDTNFEYYFGKKANKKRRLYNARLECNVYMYDSKIKAPR
ncbi:MAG: class I SAM-dependent RNA methyltransferase [Eubacteriales bacterium]|nr:class I SAM-dependent RNA methyltransferase [Eubacteriales bacterium]